MSETLEILSQYGYLVLFALVLAEQIGLPIPAVPGGFGKPAGLMRQPPVMNMRAQVGIPHLWREAETTRCILK